MNKKIITAALSLAVSFSANAVVGHANGDRVDYNDYPFYAQIAKIVDHNNGDGAEVQPFCGGTILTENKILTAAHCVDSYVYEAKFVSDSGAVSHKVENDIENLFVLVYNNTYNKAKPKELKKIRSIDIMGSNISDLANDEYIQLNYPSEFLSADHRTAPRYNDVAIITLEKEIYDNVDTVKIANLNGESSFDLSIETLKVAGNGFDTSYVDIHGDLKATNDGVLNEVITKFVNDNATSTLDNENCDHQLTDITSTTGGSSAKLKEQTICTTHPVSIDNPTENDYFGLGRACVGDSGGPLLVDINGELIQVGIVSRGTPSCSTKGLSMFVDLQNPDVVSFINDKASDFGNHSFNFTNVSNGKSDQTSLGDHKTTEEVCSDLNINCLTDDFEDTVIDDTTEKPSESASGSSGGSTGLITLLGLGLLGLRRNKKQ